MFGFLEIVCRVGGSFNGSNHKLCIEKQLNKSSEFSKSERTAPICLPVPQCQKTPIPMWHRPGVEQLADTCIKGSLLPLLLCLLKDPPHNGGWLRYPQFLSSIWKVWKSLAELLWKKCLTQRLSSLLPAWCRTSTSTLFVFSTWMWRH